MFPFRLCRPKKLSRIILIILLFALGVGALRAQQPVTSAPRQEPTPAPQQQTPGTPDETFDTLLSDDSYKLYLEVRNVGQLLTTGGAGEIVEPIIRLADPGPQLKSVVAFLKEHAEELATSRLMFVTWPARAGIPTTMVAIEFTSPEEAAKFTPRLERFLPEVMPPVPVAEPTPENSPPPLEPPANASEAKTEIATQKPTAPAAKTVKPSATPETRPPFVLTHSGSLVFISDKPFQPATLHPRGRGLLADDNNFRVARDRFASEPLFFFFNVKLEDKTQPKPSPTPVISGEERLQKQRQEEIDRAMQEAEASRAEQAHEEQAKRAAEMSEKNPSSANVELTVAAVPEASPTPTPTREQEAQRLASNQISSLLNLLDKGDPQWPDAIGLAVALDNEEYVLRALLIESETPKRLTLPFLPQLISGPPNAPEAPSILPDDTELFASTSIDFTQTYQAVKKQAEASAKEERQRLAASAEMPVDSFANFEKRAGLKIGDDLLPVLGNEMAIGMSLKQANMVNMFGVPTPPASKSSTEKKNGPEPLPIFMVTIGDGDAARGLMPRVLDGLGIGEAKMIAQAERVGEGEIVNFAGFFPYAFLGNSDRKSTRLNSSH